jgi:hypothetical protein
MPQVEPMKIPGESSASPKYKESNPWYLKTNLKMERASHGADAF